MNQNVRKLINKNKADEGNGHDGKGLLYKA